MNGCPDVRALMLEAEPEALAGRGGDAVAVHLRSCAACAAQARRILEDTEELNRFLAEEPAAPDVEGLLRRALDSPAARRDPGVVRFPSWRRWSALAAAAAVTGLLLFRGDPPLQVAVTSLPHTPPLVESAPTQNVAVMATANPDITVLWFYQ